MSQNTYTTSPLLYWNLSYVISLRLVHHSIHSWSCFSSNVSCRICLLYCLPGHYFCCLSGRLFCSLPGCLLRYPFRFSAISFAFLALCSAFFVISYWRKSSDNQASNNSVLIHPLSLKPYLVPRNSPFVHAGLRLCALKITMGGIACPITLEQPTIVTCPFLKLDIETSGAFLGNFIRRFRIERNSTLVYIVNLRWLVNQVVLHQNLPQKREVLIHCLLIYCVHLYMSSTVTTS